jgi:cytochrome c
MKPHILFVLMLMSAFSDTVFAKDKDIVYSYEAMIELAWDSGCFNCHDVRDEVRGPPWVKVAERYRGDESALDRLAATVKKGGGGNWGDDRMSSNRRVSDENIRILVKWLLTLAE